MSYLTLVTCCRCEHEQTGLADKEAGKDDEEENEVEETLDNAYWTFKALVSYYTVVT